MKPLPIIVAAVAFLIPIGVVVGGNLLSASNADGPILGTLHYFYAPG